MEWGKQNCNTVRTRIFHFTGPKISILTGLMKKKKSTILS